MARNRVQFQKGLSEAEFVARYGSEEKCRAAVIAWRWRDGFVCPHCGERRYSHIATRDKFQCSACRAQTSPIAGTIFASTKVALTTWFRAMYHLTQSKQGISSIELGRRLGVTQTTAWKIKTKLAEVMRRSADKDRLAGRIEMDDAYLGGERSGGKTGRGSPGKTPIVVAVETTDDNKPKRIKLRRIARFKRRRVKSLTKRIIAVGAKVVTDGLGCFRGVADAGCMHQPIRTGSGRQAARHPAFTWANTTLGNIKSAIVGTYRAIRRKHISRTLAEFEWRFNHRTNLAAMIPILGYAAVRTGPVTYGDLKWADYGA
jgi:ribosomal protein L37AE/L43A